MANIIANTNEEQGDFTETIALLFFVVIKL
jgi:hypothetical protein